MANPDPKHDFAAKLRQPSVLPRVMDYIQWQRMVRQARAEGIDPPQAPLWLAPISLNLDLTTACNYHCDHCIDWEMLNSRLNYKYEKLLESLEEMIRLGLRSVILIGGGEPTVYPKFCDLVRFLKARGTQVAIVSNGSRNEKILEIADRLNGRDWVRLSLDSGYNETFTLMHRPRKPITLEEICSWVPLIRERNPSLSVGFSFIITWEGATRGNGVNIVPNIHEIVMAARLARKSRFRYISFKPFLTRGPEGAEVLDASAVKHFNDTMLRIREAIDEAKTYETPDFRVVESMNLKVLMDGTWREYTRQPRVCHMQALRQVLSPLGLYNCPAHRGVPKARIADKDAFSGDGDLSATLGATAAILDRFDASRECAQVTCLYNSVNWMLEKAVQDGDDLEEIEERGDWFL